MDWVGFKENGFVQIKRYRYVLLIFLIGVFLMLLPDTRKEDPPDNSMTSVESPSLQESLADLLSRISGAGKVEVLLTEAAGERIYYQTDEDITSGDHTSDIRRSTVLVTDADREKTGLIKQVLSPTYRGAVILCQGAENANVKLAIVEAVSNATGLSTDKITVLKMK